jgi:MFS family permease
VQPVDFRRFAAFESYLTTIASTNSFTGIASIRGSANRLLTLAACRGSLAGAAINYVVMAFAPQLRMLLLGRAIAGLTSANISVATAYITDISPEDERARHFGLFNAMFGIGFIIGPVLGGLLGDHWLRLPFIAAAVLNAGNLLVALFILPESHTPARQKVDLGALNPLRPLRWVLRIGTSMLPSTAMSDAFHPGGNSARKCATTSGAPFVYARLSKIESPSRAMCCCLV